MTIPKFRAWTEEGEVMYYDVYPFKDDTLLLSYDEISFDEVPASDFILMQSTGLFDENDKEIFDGDIVVEEYRDSLNYGRVFYSEKKACHRVEFKNLVNGFDLADVAVKFVAGNVYENPALLEGEE